MTLVLIAMVTMVVVVLMLTTVRPHLIPPGPRLLPLIGNLHLFWGCDDVRELVKKLRTKYGDIYSLYLGHKLLIVINGTYMIKQTFLNNGDRLVNRPNGCKSKGILNTNGKVWRRNRRFVHLTLRDLDISSDVLEAKIAPEMIHLASTLIDLGEEAFHPAEIVTKIVSNVIFNVTLGERFPWDRPEAVALFNALTDIVGRGRASPMTQTMSSWQSWLPWKRLKKFQSLKKAEGNLRQLIRRYIKQRLQVLEDDAMCITDAYLLQMREHGPDDKSLDGESLVQLIMELIEAGTETMSSTLQWLLYYLALNQEVQTKAHEEIDSELEGSFPVWPDADRLPYLEALILESQRLADVKPFSMSYLSSDSLVLDGMNIPRNALLVPNVTSVLYDEGLFPEPEVFRPERFLGRRGERLKNAGFIPYFLGRRKCVGELLARMELFLLTAAMIQHFRFVLPEDAPSPSLRSTLGRTRQPVPFKLIAKRRSEL